MDLDPDSRITAEGALSHPYLAQYADPTDEPTSDPYDQSFEERDFEIPTWRSEYPGYPETKKKKKKKPGVLATKANVLRCCRCRAG